MTAQAPLRYIVILSSIRRCAEGKLLSFSPPDYIVVFSDDQPGTASRPADFNVREVQACSSWQTVVGRCRAQQAESQVQSSQRVVGGWTGKIARIDLEEIPPPGIEPGSPAPEADALSITPWGQLHGIYLNTIAKSTVKLSDNNPHRAIRPSTQIP